MLSFLVYEGKVAVVLLVFYLFYRFLLKKETFHRFNRIVLVGTAVLSFLLPLCVITIRKPAEPGVMVMEMTAEMRELAPVVGKTFPSWPVLLVILLFWAGVAFVLVRVIVSILSILKITRQGELVREDDGCRIVVTDRNIDPFSWMRYIVLSRKDWESNPAPILAHEKAHFGFRHSVESLLVDVLSAFQWFNPAIWMLRSDLRELHEYEADDAVLRSGFDIKEYQYLLIRKAVGKSGYSVANSFNHSILKNRITMMSKSPTPLSRCWRLLYLLPLVCLAIGLQARTVYVPTGEDNHRKGLVVLRINEDGTVTMDGREVSREDIAKELEEHIRSLDVPKWLIAVKIEADENAPEDAQSYVKNSLWDAFHASSEHIYILRSANGKETEISREEFRQINQGRIGSVDVLEGDDAIEKYGEKAASGVVLVNMKRPQELDEIVVTSYGDKDEDEVVRFVPAEPSTMPMFQGEDRMAFSRWLNARIRRPKGCTHQGEMKVSFVVGTDGKVRDVKVTQSICEALDAMVTSQIEQSPEWEPATLNGDPVEQGLSIPIVFQMR